MVRRATGHLPVGRLACPVPASIPLPVPQPAWARPATSASCLRAVAALNVLSGRAKSSPGSRLSPCTLAKGALTWERLRLREAPEPL